VYELIAETIVAARCQAVGLMLAGDGAEYPFWVFLGAPRSDVRIEWIVAGTPSARYVDPDFEPCAVVCDRSCPSEWTRVRDIPLHMELSGYRLFLAP
jgi:hypothetical protein